MPYGRHTGMRAPTAHRIDSAAYRTSFRLCSVGHASSFAFKAQSILSAPNHEIRCMSQAVAASPVVHATSGGTGATVSSTGILENATRPSESMRRKANAAGMAVGLAGGDEWLLARPVYCASNLGLTMPRIDGHIDQIFDCSILSEELGVSDLTQLLGQLLSPNYELSPEEVRSLVAGLSLAELRCVAESAVDALLGPEDTPRGFVQWARASLLANGLGGIAIPAEDLTGVLEILVATHRTIPLAKFADACRIAEERTRLDSLV